MTGAGMLDCKSALDEGNCDLDKAIELDGKFAGAYYYRGLCYKATSQTDKARADFQAAVKYSEDPIITGSAQDELKSLN